MSAVVEQDNTSDPIASAPVKPSWGPPQYLAILGVPFLVVMTWTLIAWMADGPHQITAYRTERGPDYWSARFFESLTVLLALVVLAKVIRDCRRERRVLTFDVIFIIAGISLFWLNGACNFFAPYLTYTSHLVNVNDPCGYIPAVVNPDCSRTPNPYLLITGITGFLIPGAAMVFGVIAGRIHRRWPRLTRPQLFFIICAIGSASAVMNEFIYIPLQVWTYPGSPFSLDFGDGLRYPLFPEFIGYGLMIGIPAAMRYFKNEKGQRFVERGMDHYSPRLRTFITVGAVYFVMQICMLIPATAFLWPQSLHQTGDGWTKVAPTLNNGMCDSPRANPDTRYGPCPGSAGFSLPTHSSVDRAPIPPTEPVKQES